MNAPASQRPSCPCCGQPFPFDDFQWIDRLEELISRHEGLGIAPGLSHMNVTEAWGVYRWLDRAEWKDGS